MVEIVFVLDFESEPKNKLIKMKTVFEKLLDNFLIELVFDFKKSVRDSINFSRQPFSFSKNYIAIKWRKWFSKLEKSEIEMIIIFKSKQELFSLFKLIKLTGDFSNTYYILSFDDEMVASAIGEIEKNHFGGRTDIRH